MGSWDLVFSSQFLFSLSVFVWAIWTSCRVLRAWRRTKDGISIFTKVLVPHLPPDSWYPDLFRGIGYVLFSPVFLCVPPFLSCHFSIIISTIPGEARGSSLHQQAHPDPFSLSFFTIPCHSFPFPYSWPASITARSRLPSVCKWGGVFPVGPPRCILTGW